MLVLTRRPKESIIIGQGKNKAEVRILDVKGNQVSIGIDADPSVKILREELVGRDNKSDDRY